MQPVIGITSYGRTEAEVKGIHYDAHYVSPAQYVDAVVRAGGVPVLLPPNPDQIDAWMGMVDGFVIAGGADIDPSHYGGQVGHPEVQDAPKDRDQVEQELVHRLVADGNKPALMICRGMQVVNVALGGSLVEHIPDEFDEDIHRNAEGGWTVQAVDVADGSRLHEVMGAARVYTYSGHHQAIRQVAEGLTISATAPDGIIEALEIPQHPYFIAVQWHPEVSADSDPTQQRLFDGLVAAATAAQGD